MLPSQEGFQGLGVGFKVGAFWFQALGSGLPMRRIVREGLYIQEIRTRLKRKPWALMAARRATTALYHTSQYKYRGALRAKGGFGLRILGLG